MGRSQHFAVVSGLRQLMLASQQPPSFKLAVEFVLTGTTQSSFPQHPLLMGMVTK